MAIKRDFNISIGPLGLLSLFISMASLTVGLLSYYKANKAEQAVSCDNYDVSKEGDLDE